MLSYQPIKDQLLDKANRAVRDRRYCDTIGRFQRMTAEVAEIAWILE